MTVSIPKESVEFVFVPLTPRNSQSLSEVTVFVFFAPPSDPAARPDSEDWVEAIRVPPENHDLSHGNKWWIAALVGPADGAYEQDEAGDWQAWWRLRDDSDQGVEDIVRRSGIVTRT